jgi:hydrogenase nickel incorporation protein HypA/HybF
MSIAEGILDIALDYASRSHAKRIREIGLKLGEMSGVVEDSLTFSFRVIAKGTAAEDAKLKIERIPLMGRCSKCGREFHIEHYDFFCPVCGDGVLVTISGREMQVDYLEVD